MTMEYSYSLLSEAAYADLEGVETSAQLLNALVGVNGEVDPDKGFSQIRAEEFIRHWRVVDHLPDTSIGYSATVFQGLDNPDDFGLTMHGNEQLTHS
ncbi:MAG: hypothetical protein JAZ12_08095 [Candidatus Thiodiazotropha taylori]|nr:hypothetical protein [Candidatus Thiodiazotropha taylori]